MSLPEMMRSAVLTAALLLPCQALCELAHTNESSQAWPTKEWRTSTPEEQGMGSAALAKLVDYGATHELESMLIVRHGAIVAEAYYAPFRAGVKHRMNSATKSVIGTLVAIALKEGRLSSTDQRAVDFFADRTIANLDDRKRAITIQNLLDMTSGLSWTEPLGDGRPQSMIAMERSADWTQFVLDQPMTDGPGTTFNYSSGNPHLLSAILTKTTGESALDYARERLFGPLGISDVFWRQDPQGVSIGGFGLFLQPRDMAKLGYLWLRNGVWDGAEIIPQAWIDRIRHATIPMGIANLRYGNLFWVDPDSGVFYANGFHGQRIFVAPALDVVAVATATGFSASGSAMIGMIADAVKSDGPLPPDVASQSLLASRIREAATEKPLPVGQTPDIAKTISGKVFRFADNPLRLDSLTLTLDGPNPSYAYAFKPARPDSAAERFEGPIGLDGLYRTGSPRPEGTIPAAKGGWSYDGSFVVQFEDLGGDNLRRAFLSFKGEGVDLVLVPENGYSIKLHGEAAD